MSLMLGFAAGVQQPLVASSPSITSIAGASRPQPVPSLSSGGHLHQLNHYQDDIRHFWGQYSPYFNSTSAISPETPEGCETTFVQVLARHGSRYPTAKKSKTYAAFFKNFLPHVRKSSLKKGKYEFLSNYTYDLGNSSLTVAGRLELSRLAIDIYWHYTSLIEHNETAVPFLRAAGEQRVVDSAWVFARTLSLARLDNMPPSTPPDSIPDLPILVIPESVHSNNTLNGDGCKNFKTSPYTSIARHAQKAFADRYFLPITERLNADLELHRHRKLGIPETIYLMDMCAFDTAALQHPFPPSRRTHDATGVSPFCGMFSDSEFHKYSYYQSLGKFYGYSLGNPLGPSLGIGFVNELISRLTGEPVDDHTSTNSTLDSDPLTFPIGKSEDGKLNRVFADFSHDNTIAGIHAAMGLFGRPDKPHLRLPVDKVVDESKVHGFSASATTPFASRTIIEKLTCKHEREEMVRVIVNGRVMRLKSCHGDKRGLCTLSKFLKSLDWAKSGGKYAKCFD